jgi:DNA-binding NarL/FixJ family response regulator
MAVTVLVAARDAADRTGARLALEEGGLTVCAEAADADAAVAAAIRHRPAVCLVDGNLPGNGLAATARIAAKVPETAVVVLAESTRDDDLLDALRAGAVGYLLKDTNPERLPAVVAGVLRGEAALSRRLVARLIEEFRERGVRKQLTVAGGRSVELTGRESDVLDLLLQGLSTLEISRRLFISPGTVRTHVAAVLRKLHVPDREAAIQLLQR